MRDVHFELTDLTPEEFASNVLNDPCRFHLYTDEMISDLHSKKDKFDAIAAPEARGFIVGSVVAKLMHKPFIQIRKARKEERAKAKVKCSYYYGNIVLTVPVHIRSGLRVWLVDDDFMSGGTALASIRVIEMAGGQVVGVSVLVEWVQLLGRQRLRGIEVYSVCKALRVL